jgi:ABC-2 type transport system permease protein
MRSARILHAQLRLSLMVALQYRVDFLMDITVEAFWTVAAILPLFVVFRHTTSLAGWSLSDALAVSGVFTLFQGVMESIISPSFALLLEQVKKGAFDFVLIKPVDAQFLASTGKLQPWRALNVLVGLLLVAYSALHAQSPVSAWRVLFFLAMLVLGLLLFYALWLILASAVFVVKRLDNLTYLLVSIFDAGRWPRSAFRGVFRLVFTFVIPIALMTSFPAEALLGRLSVMDALLSVAITCAMLVASRMVWTAALLRYGSASS